LKRLKNRRGTCTQLKLGVNERAHAENFLRDYIDQR